MQQIVKKKHGKSLQPVGDCVCETLHSCVQAGIEDLKFESDFGVKIDEIIDIDVPLTIEASGQQQQQQQRPNGSATGSFWNMRLSGEVRVQVTQKMRMQIPLNVVTDFSETFSDCDEVKVPVQKHNPHKTAPSPSPSEKSNEAPAPTPITPKPTKLNIFLNARDLPIMDITSCDPYYNFYLDQGNGWVKKSGGPRLAIKNQRKGAWSFNILQSEILASRQMKVEMWDFDTIGKDDFIGEVVFNCSQFSFKKNGGITDAKLVGPKAAKANSVIDLSWRFEF